MFIRDELDDYFMKPYKSNIGNIYPIKIYDYYKFKKIASKYIIPSNEMMFNLYKLPKEINLFEYYVENGLYVDNNLNQLNELKDYIPKNKEEEKYLSDIKTTLDKYKNEEFMYYSIKEMEEMFSLIFREEVVFNNETLSFVDKLNKIKVDKNNFDFIREVVMHLNVLQEIPTNSNPYINEMIQHALELKNKESSNGGNLCAMVSFISIKKGISDRDLMEYTYYRLLYDYSIAIRENTNNFLYLLRSQGCNEAKIIEISEKLDLRINYKDLLLENSNNMSNLDNKLK